MKVDCPFRQSRFIVTPVKTGVHPHPLKMDTVFQRYDGPFPIETFTASFRLT